MEERLFLGGEVEEVSFLGKRIDERWYPIQWMMEERRILVRGLREVSFLEKQIDERCL